jgi:hypothetical protein
MRRALSLALLPFLGGCGGSAAGPTTTPEGGAISDADNATDGPSMREGSSPLDGTSGGAPVDHRAAGVACPQQRGPGMLPASCDYDSGPAPGCLHDSDCTQGNNGRCSHPDLTPAICVTACSYDECFSDTDCPAKTPCACRQSATDSTANTCVGGSQCRIDSDCGPGGYCSPSAGFGAFQCGIAYFCHTAADTCLNDTDCGAAKCQYDRVAGHWHCGGATCAPPP